MNFFNRVATSFCLIILLNVVVNNSADAKVYLDIYSPTMQKFSIAIPEFQMTPDGELNDELSVWFPNTIGNYLKMTGFFDVINKKPIIKSKDPSAPSQIVFFENWAVVGAEYLIEGFYQTRRGTVVVDFRLFDVVKKELICQKNFSEKLEGKNTIAKGIAAEILSALTGDGRIFDTTVAFIMKKGKTSDIYSVNFDGSDLKRLTDYGSITLSPRLSHEGRRLMFTSYMNGTPELFIKDLNTNAVKKIADFRGINLSGAWSKNSEKALFTSSKDGNEEIYMINIVTGEMNRLTYNYSIDVSPTFSYDDKKIAFVSNRSGSPQIYVMNSDGSDIKRLTYEGNYNSSPAWSPKENKIAYEGLINGRFQIFIMDESGEGNYQVTSGSANHESPAWSPDGRYIAFSMKHGGKSRIYIMNSNGSNQRLLFEGSGDCVSPSWSLKSK